VKIKNMSVQVTSVLLLYEANALLNALLNYGNNEQKNQTRGKKTKKQLCVNKLKISSKNCVIKI